MKEKVLQRFYEVFGKDGEASVWFSPGRVNLIGEHTDYNGGHVFPCALTMGTYFAVRKRSDRALRFYSENFARRGVTECSLDRLTPDPENGWANYPLGMFWVFKEHGMEAGSGYDVLLWGTIPNGSGLSSSASVEVGTGTFLRDMEGFDVDMARIAQLGQESENRFNGVNCGIMDQFSIAMGKKDCAVFLDTNSLTYEYAPVVLTDECLIIASSNKKRKLGESKYNERRSECEEALRRLQKRVNAASLGALRASDLISLKEEIGDPVLYRRARHAVTENERTVKAVRILKEGDLAGFGRLMTASHMSLKDDYEVTGPELDCLVEAALMQDGVLGSRMTGAGFGGCTVSLVKKAAAETFIARVGEIYKDRIGYAADFYTAGIGDGARRI